MPRGVNGEVNHFIDGKLRAYFNQLLTTDKPTTKLVTVFHTYPGNQAAQFNWALDNLKIESKWVLRLDADEYLTDETVAKLREKFALDGGVVSSQSLVVGGGDAGVGDSVGDSEGITEGHGSAENPESRMRDWRRRRVLCL